MLSYVHQYIISLFPATTDSSFLYIYLQMWSLKARALVQHLTHHGLQWARGRVATNESISQVLVCQEPTRGKRFKLPPCTVNIPVLVITTF